jgi:heptosyltransferase-3
MNRILVIATRQIGDVLLTTPVIEAAHEIWPQATIDVLGFAGSMGMLAGNPHVHETIATPAKLGVRGTWKLARRLWRRYDLALITQPGDRAHLIGLLASGCRSGLLPEQGGSNWWKRLLLDHAVKIAGDRGSVHVTVEKLALLDPWMQQDAIVPKVLPPSPGPLPDAIRDQLQAGYVVVHSPSMWTYKQWPMPYFQDLVRGLLDAGRQVVLTGSGAQRDQECIAQLRPIAPAPRLLDASAQLDFRQLATLLEGAALYIGPDTSVSHLAAATGVKTLAIYGPTNPQRWAPWPAKAPAREIFERSRLQQSTGNVTLLQSDLPCVPCGRAGCEDHLQSRSDCLQAISPARVLDQALQLLRTGGPAAAAH